MSSRLVADHGALALVLVPVLGLASACGPTPSAVLTGALQAIERHDAAALDELVDPAYRDPLGGKRELLRDLVELGEAFAKVEVKVSELSFADGATKLEAHAVGRLDAELDGEVAWRATGPLAVELVRDGRYRVRSGLLDDLRGAIALFSARRAALEANDVESYVALLHPAYADGDLDREGARARLTADLAGLRIRLRPSLYKLEVRGDLAHVDEHYELLVGDRTVKAAVGRFTLRRAAGLWRIAAGLYPSGP